jgi:hypothetical protein
MLKGVFETETTILASTECRCLEIKEGNPKNVRRCKNIGRVVNKNLCIECRDATYEMDLLIIWK